MEELGTQELSARQYMVLAHPKAYFCFKRNDVWNFSENAEIFAPIEHESKKNNELHTLDHQ